MKTMNKSTLDIVINRIFGHKEKIWSDGRVLIATGGVTLVTLNRLKQRIGAHDSDISVTMSSYGGHSLSSHSFVCVSLKHPAAKP